MSGSGELNHKSTVMKSVQSWTKCNEIPRKIHISVNNLLPLPPNTLCKSCNLSFSHKMVWSMVRLEKGVQKWVSTIFQGVSLILLTIGGPSMVILNLTEKQWLLKILLSFMCKSTMSNLNVPRYSQISANFVFIVKYFFRLVIPCIRSPLQPSMT